jgi:hypothetical protein
MGISIPYYYGNHPFIILWEYYEKTPFVCVLVHNICSSELLLCNIVPKGLCFM